MSHTQQVKLVLNQALSGIRNFGVRTKSKDDSVEAQADTLRIWMWASSAGLALIVVATIGLHRRVDETVPANGERDLAMADQLPNGFVLVPIEPTNLDSLDSVFGQHGYADLYRADGSQQKGRRLAHGVALIRSPRNPRRFAVLAPESESTHLSELAEPVLVILRRGPVEKVEQEKTKIASGKRPRAVRKIDLIEEGQPDVISLNETGEDL